jgi:site-specific recombinase XerD
MATAPAPSYPAAQSVARRQPMLVGLDIDDAIASYRTHLRARGLRDQTVDRLYVPRLRKLGAFVRERGMPHNVAAITREHLEAWIDHLQHDAVGRSGVGQKPATVSIAYRTMRPFWRWLVAEDEIKRSPMENMRPPRVDEEAPPVLRPEQLDALLKTCDRPGLEARRDKALILLLSSTGMRRGEVAGLTVEDVDRELDVIHLRPETTKSRRGRAVPFDRSTAKALDRYLRIRRQHPYADSGWLWLGKRGRLSDSGILQMVERRGRLAGIVGLHPHLFRHSFAHNMLAAGMQEGDVALIAGWQDRQMLARYGRSAAAERAIDAYRRLDRGSS